jgi:hypothetical protein
LLLHLDHLHHLALALLVLGKHAVGVRISTAPKTQRIATFGQSRPVGIALFRLLLGSHTSIVGSLLRGYAAGNEDGQNDEIGCFHHSPSMLSDLHWGYSGEQAVAHFWHTR